MGAGEYRGWLAYRKKFGPMNDVRRYDRVAAIIATVTNRLHGGKAKLEDYMPWGKDQDDSEEVSFGDLVKHFGEVQRGKSR